LIVFIAICLLVPPSRVQAQETLPGGRGGNLVVREGNVDIQKETIEVKLHLGFAEVLQNLVIKNGSASQKVTFGFPYRLGRSDQSLNNITIKIDGAVISPDSNKESDGQEFIYWKLFTVECMPEQARTIELSHWQLNSANIRGFRSFNYSLKNQFETIINDFELRLSMMDGVYLKNFDRGVNLDLDLKLEPLGWEEKGNILAWRWEKFVPSLDINANFYWPGGDLAKTADLSQNLGLYQTTASSNHEQSSLLTDSSYLTAWGEKSVGPGLGNTLDLQFPGRTISEIGIIPGNAADYETFRDSSRPKELKLVFSDSTEKIITLADEMQMQYFALEKPVSANHVKITLNSIYAGDVLADETYISEIELETKLTQANTDKAEYTNNQPAWQRFFSGLWNKIINWFKKIF